MLPLLLPLLGQRQENVGWKCGRLRQPLRDRDRECCLLALTCQKVCLLIVVIVQQRHVDGAGAGGTRGGVCSEGANRGFMCLHVPLMRQGELDGGSSGEAQVDPRQ